MTWPLRTSTSARRAGAGFILALGVLLVADPAASQERCGDAAAAAFWNIDPTHWREHGRPELPETALLDEQRPHSLGVAFSGGGTRSMAATIGQLRGLEKNGWLGHVRYMSAVSGGSWAAIPYVYYRGDIDSLLGNFIDSHRLDPDALRRVPSGSLARRIVDARLLHAALWELPQLLPRQLGGRDITAVQQILANLTSNMRRLSSSPGSAAIRRDKTYARMLGHLFLDADDGQIALVRGGSTAPYTWDRRAAVEITEATGCPAADFVQIPEDRPFLIVGATVVLNRQDFVYPRLVPVEFTPFYTGIRQHFGRLGGTYVAPWAYDRALVAPGGDGMVRVWPGPHGNTVTLADVMAASGAAPALTALLGTGLPEGLRERLRAAADFFPSLRNVTVRNGEAILSDAPLLHGDGGYVDNLAIMPLLARQVRNIIVFVNSNREWNLNDQLQSYFTTVLVRDGAGDKSMNRVFESNKYLELLDGLDRAAMAGEAAVYCADNWTVNGNELYNVRGYHGLNICWIYNHAAEKWKDGLPEEVRSWLDPPGDRLSSRERWRRSSSTARRNMLRRERVRAVEDSPEAADLEQFPYYATFLENAPRLIRLSTLQVNLLADLAAWSVTHVDALQKITKAFGKELVPSPAVTSKGETAALGEAPPDR